MKIEFKNTLAHINSGTVFFLYGNYKKSFDAFCNFVFSKLKEKYINVKLKNCSMTEFEKIQKFSQGDLFDDNFSCICIKGIEDKHLEKIMNFSHENKLFVLESGDYFKSKKITEILSKDKNIFSVASFNNNLTLNSLCNLLLPKLPQVIYDEIIKIINSTDENLVSLFEKISLLVDENIHENLKEYATYKNSFLKELDSIGFIRFALQAAIKENIFHQNQDYIKMNLTDKIHFLMDAEIKQKLSYPFNKNYLYQNLLIKK